MAASRTQPFFSSAATARFPSQPRSASSATWLGLGLGSGSGLGLGLG